MNSIPMILLAATLAGAGSVETEAEKPYTDEDLYILFDDNGNCAYAPVDWFWEGNG